MADRKITELTALSAGSQAVGDLLTIVDVSEAAAADKNKKVTVENLFKGIPGDVGIGATTPAAKLEIARLGADWTGAAPASGTGLFIHNGNNGADSQSVIQISGGSNSYSQISFGDENDASIGSVKYDHSNNSLSFEANNSERARLDSSGRLLVGSTTGAGQLEVRSSTALGIISRSTSTQGTDSNKALRVRNNSDTDTFSVSYRGQGYFAGRLLLGLTTARANFFNASNAPQLQLESTSLDGATASIVRNANNTAASAFVLGKTRGTSVGDNTVVQSGDTLGTISFQGADGSELVEAAKISGAVDATPGANDMPGRLVFSTTADGASSPTEHFRIASNGDLTATDTTIGSNSDSRLKTNVADFIYNLEDFKQYRPKTFDWKNPEIHGNKAGQRGFIAQDVEAVDGYWVSQQKIDEDSADAQFLDEDRIAKTLKLGKKDAMYVSVIQQLLTKIETLEAKVAALEAQ